MKITMKYHSIQIQSEQDSDIDTLLQDLHQSKKARYLLYQNKQLYLNGNLCKQNQLITKNDEVQIHLPDETLSSIPPDFTELSICYEDELLLAVNKPSHLLVHSDGVDTSHTLCNRVQGYYLMQGITAPVRPLHRLDKETSGIVLFCKIPFFQPLLDHMMKEKQIQREYEAIVEGSIHQKKQTITYPIARDRHDARKMRVSATGKHAKTTITLQKNYGAYSWIHARLFTGRTHQIRVHLAALKHPLLSDSLYGTPSDKIHRLALHASLLTLQHPFTNQKIQVTCEMPLDMKDLL